MIARIKALESQTAAQIPACRCRRSPARLPWQLSLWGIQRPHPNVQRAAPTRAGKNPALPAAARVVHH